MFSLIFILFYFFSLLLIVFCFRIFNFRKSDCSFQVSHSVLQGPFCNCERSQFVCDRSQPCSNRSLLQLCERSHLLGDRSQNSPPECQTYCGSERSHLLGRSFALWTILQQPISVHQRAVCELFFLF
jgi:hypothetical protein